jgi:hypothetical protein
MKITLTKKVTLTSGKKLAKGLTLSVVNEYGQELIEAGKAVEFGAEAPVIIEEQLNNLD